MILIVRNTIIGYIVQLRAEGSEVDPRPKGRGELISFGRANCPES